MGNVVHKGKVHHEPINVVTAQAVNNDNISGEITEVLLESLMFPVTPSEDVTGKYIWVYLNLHDPKFIQYQEHGFRISTNNKDLTVGPVWLKKKRE